ncbi:MAG TPA: hypothetical protein VFV34_26730, partial [Blastocatellia bacterium]|nr:hypothetical protein [Blastocatellia bacterium]
ERLEEEKSLSAGLSALVTAESGESASSLLEMRLRTAFRQRHAIPVSAKVTSRRTRRLAFAGLVAAAVILIVVAAALLTKKPDVVPVTPKEAGVDPGHQEPAPIPEPPMPAPYRAGAKPNRRYSPKAVVAQQPSVQHPVELATSFIPLTRGDAPVVDSWRLVRAEVPKSSLTMLGLPVNWESPEDRVKADFLVGNDGLAYAVRFVR